MKKQIIMIILFFMGQALLISNGYCGDFNTSDINIENNKNAYIAIPKVIASSRDTMLQNVKNISIENITMSHYSSIGKICRISGQVRMIQELPLGAFGNWHGIILACINSNSNVGFTSVQMLYNGDVKNIKSRSIVTIVGYYIGIDETENAMGGTVEMPSFVGNIVDSSIKKRKVFD